MKPKLTIRDIAGLAGVSHTTVSRVLNYDSKVRPETAKKVLQIIEEYNYRPDPLAQKFARRRSNLIGLLLDDISNPFFAELARGIEDKAREHGYHVIFCSTDDTLEGTQEFTNIMRETGVDGLIYTSAHLKDPAVERLIDAHFPLVMVNRRLKIEKGSYVVLDNWMGARMLTQHLIEHGYKRIALVNGPSRVSTGIERLKGFKKALNENGIPLRDEFIHEGPWTLENGCKGAEKLLSTKERPDAIFGGNDVLAIGVMIAAEKVGLRIPKDLALVGFDDSACAQSMKLTTVSQRKYEMGELAVQTLVQHMQNRQIGYAQRIVLEPRLILRESCGCHKTGPEETHQG